MKEIKSGNVSRVLLGRASTNKIITWSRDNG